MTGNEETRTPAGILIASLRMSGENLAHQGFHAEALATLQKAAALAPADQAVRGALAKACRAAASRLEAAGMDAAAENRHRQALSLSSGADGAAAGLSAFLRRRAERLAGGGERAAAATCLIQAHLLAPDDPKIADEAATHTALVTALADPEDKAGRGASLSGYYMALAANPGNQELASTMSNLLCDLAQPMIFDGRPTEAVPGLREAFRLQPRLERARRLLALALCQAGIAAHNVKHLGEAEAAAWEALTLVEDLPEAIKVIELCARHSERQVVAVIDADSGKAARALSDLLQIKDVPDCGLVRKGLRGDGGYVMVDHRLGDTVAYSLGVGNDVSWDYDMAEAGCQIFQYDHTIESLPAQHANFHWSKLGVAARPDDDSRLRTLTELIAANGHDGRDDLILKIDIEGYEWDVLAEISPATLGAFTQIVGEFHHMPGIVDPGKRPAMLAALGNLAKQFELVHMHANNWGTAAIVGGITLPRHFELTYLRRDSHRFVKTTRRFPGPLDCPNVPGLPDYLINPFS